jgi:DNA-binding response OmpR family regulator
MRVLVVDDEPWLRDTLSLALRRAGHEPVVAEDGRLGLAALESGAFDAVITDILMPQCDGIELIRAMRGAGRPEPVLAISGGGTYGSDYLLPMARKLGAVAVMRKPFAPAEIVGALESVVQGSPGR